MVRRCCALLCLLFCACGSGGGNTTEDASGDADAVEEILIDVSEDGEPVPDGSRCTGDEDCDDGDPCTTDTCDVGLGDCEHDDLDEDEDGHYAEFAPGGVRCGGSDCDDTDPDVHPSTSLRLCDGDADCNGNDDSDNDLDGSVREACGGDDCNDDEEAVHPGAEPGCGTDASDPLGDLDCNGLADEDNDDDDHVNVDCGGDDCDDSRTDVFLDAPEVCADGVDQDCDTLVDGLMLMPATPTHVSTFEGSGTEQSIAWTGSEFGVAFHSSSDPDAENELSGWGLDASGALVPRTPVLTDNYYDSMDPEIAWTGSRYAVVWERYTNNFMGYKSIFLMTRMDDWTLDGSINQLAATSIYTETPSLAWTGSTLGVCWSEATLISYYYVTCNSFDLSGTALWTSNTVISDPSNNVVYPDIVWSGSEYGVAWQISPTTGDASESFFRPMASDGTLLRSPVSLSSGSAPYSYVPRVAWAGSQWALAWTETSDGTTVDPFLQMLDTTGLPTSTEIAVSTSAGTGSSPVPLWTGSEVLVSWMDYRSGLGSIQVYSRLFDPAGTAASSEIQVTSTTSPSVLPEVAFAGDVIGITWLEEGSGGIYDLDVYFDRLGFCD